MITKIQPMHIQNLRNIFLKSLESVRSNVLLNDTNNFNLKPRIEAPEEINIEIKGKKWNIYGKKCHVVGFGKGVLGMAAQLDKCLEKNISSGILSIPTGTLDDFAADSEMQLNSKTNIEIVEGAVNNQPDATAAITAKRIMNLASAMTPDDILFVLISGGGSALLPMPKPPCTLNEKMDIIKKLSNRGATIVEMNIVRISLSAIKGGRLAKAASNAAAVISFIISDICGDPVELIASGPTCAHQVKGTEAQDILKRFEMWESLPSHIRTIIENSSKEKDIQLGENNHIFVVGDNRIATEAAAKEARKCDYNPFIATTTLNGEVKDIVNTYNQFLNNIVNFRKNNLTEEILRTKFPFDRTHADEFLKTLLTCQKNGKPLLLILGGEPTVKVTGTGKGGRSQELCLRMSEVLYKKENFPNVYMLSGGTDGIDGPTLAAGAIACRVVIEDFFKLHNEIDLQQYINNNDSFNFYKNLHNHKYHVITGHTGTNVMDIHLILMQ